MKLTFTLALLLSSAFSLANISKPTVVYGEDNRSEPYQKPEYYAYTRGVMVQIQDTMLTNSNSLQYILNTQAHGTVYRLCSGERFADQPQAGRCSGFLVAPDTLVTAGHCVSKQSDCATMKWAFGYEVSETAGNPRALRREDVYACKSIVRNSEGSLDYAIIKLDRDTNGTPLSVLPAGQNAQVGDDLVMIGYPARLPMKVTDGAKVLSLKSNGDLVTNLDAFGGNSGSVVLNARTGQVVGILVSGKTDYISRGSCNVVNTLPMSAGGETVTSIRNVPREF